MNLLIQLIGLSMLISSSIQISTPESLTYVAGVVEYFVNQGESGTSTELYQRNTDKYIEIMNSADAANVDIIVFPESCLNSRQAAVVVPRVTEDTDLCTNETYDENLRKIACAARNLRKYVVVNLTMKRNCTEVHEMENDEHEHEHEDDHEHECTNEWLLYNTNVVFDRDGKVISIYRKYNLFGEAGITQPTSPDIRSFTTDFNVTFGHFICFDLMFQTPALALIDQGVKNIIFPTMWFSELPFLTAVQIQQNWAYSNDVNFLGAGANRPSVGSGGSGIYSGKSGALISTMTGEAKTVLLVHEVPKIPGNPVPKTSPAYSGSNLDNFKLKRDQLDKYNFQKIQLPESPATSRQETFTLCQNLENDELCCDFEIDISLQSVAENSVSYTYYAGVFNGNRTFDGVADGNIQACTIVACQNDSISSCGKRYNDSETVESNIRFDNIVISGVFQKKDVFTLPNSLNFNVSPYPTSDFTYEEVLGRLSTSGEITLTLTAPKTDLFTFAIYGRDFRSNSNKVTSTIIVLLTAFVLKFIFA